MGAKARRMEKLSANIMPHLSVSQYYHDDGDWSGVASSIAFGETEFCYLQSDRKDAYKFSMPEDYPAGHILKNDFSTMSRYGVLRNSAVTGESELVSHEVCYVHNYCLFDCFSPVHFYAMLKDL